jgi:hypothetical protein
VRGAELGLSEPELPRGSDARGGEIPLPLPAIEGLAEGGANAEAASGHDALYGKVNGPGREKIRAASKKALPKRSRHGGMGHFSTVLFDLGPVVVIGGESERRERRHEPDSFHD